MSVVPRYTPSDPSYRVVSGRRSRRMARLLKDSFHEPRTVAPHLHGSQPQTGHQELRGNRCVNRKEVPLCLLSTFTRWDEYPRPVKRETNPHLVTDCPLEKESHPLCNRKFTFSCGPVTRVLEVVETFITRRTSWVESHWEREEERGRVCLTWDVKGYRDIPRGQYTTLSTGPHISERSLRR